MTAEPLTEAPAMLPMTIEETSAALRAGDLTCTALTATQLELIASMDPTLGAFVAVCAPQAMEAAAALDAELASGIDRGPLHGIPLGVKDIIGTDGVRTTANSKILSADWGGLVDSPVVARLRAAGSIVVGKTTTSEFATGLPDPLTGFPIPHNPWNLEHSASGSSSGTGVAVAAGLVLGGLGTDTGGSVRAPASANGTTGLKVTFGRVSKRGVVPLGFTLDSVGPLARSAYDCALLLEAMAGFDPLDPYSADVPVEPFAEQARGPVDGLRIGIPEEHFFDSPGLDPEIATAVRAGIDVLAEAGADVREVRVPYAKEANAANTIIGGAEAWSYHQRHLTRHWDVYGRNTRTNLARGIMFSAGDYVMAQRFRTLFRRELATVLTEVDVLITPTSAQPAPATSGMSMFRDYAAPSFTGQWNLAGFPALALPCGTSSSGLPLSMQIVGRPFDEGTILRAGDAYQRATDWHLRAPELLTASHAG